MVVDSPRDVLLIVGCGRSGTTLVYELLCQHTAFAWISTWSDRLVRPELARFNQRWRLHRDTARLAVPVPSEGYRVWDRTLPSHGGAGSGRLAPSDLDQAKRAAMQSMMERYRRHAQAPVFLNKNTRNTRRVAFLAEAFPKSVFVHVLRHPCDAVSSQVRVAWWPDLELWTRDGATPRQLARDDVDGARLAAELWTADTRAAMEDGAQLGSDRYVEIHYEAVVEDPVATLDVVLGRVGQVGDADYTGRLRSWGLRPSVGSYRERLSAAQIRVVGEVAGDLARDVGYHITAG